MRFFPTQFLAHRKVRCPTKVPSILTTVYTQIHTYIYYIYIYIYIHTHTHIYISGLARPQGRPKNTSNNAKFISKQHNQRWTARTLIYLNVTQFLPFSHAVNKGFP